MDVGELIRKLSVDQLDPVYFVHGEETFAKRALVRRLKELLLVGPMADFNYQRIKAREMDGHELVSQARSMPMMAARRLIVVDDGEKLPVADQGVLAEYLERPALETCLVVVGTKFDLRKGLFKAANKKKWVHRAEPLKDRDLVGMVSRLAKDRNLQMDDEAKVALANAIGPDGPALEDAVERLCLYTAGAPVGAKAVAEVVSAIRVHSVFELVDALGNRQFDQVLSLLANLLANREEPIRINALLTRHIRQLLQVRIFSVERMEQRTMAQQLGVPPFVVDKLIKQSQRFRGPVLEDALRRLALADLEFKSAKRPAGWILECALLDLAL